MDKEVLFQGLPNVELSKADVVLFPLGCELTVCGLGGTAQAPKAIVEAGMDIEYFEEEMGWSPFLHMKLHTLQRFQPVGSFQELQKRVSKTLSKLKKKQLLITLGGEHSISPFVVKQRLEKGTVVFFDAHADYRKRYHKESNNHACAMYNLERQGHKIVAIGLRSFFEEEFVRLKNSKNITVYSDLALQKKKMRKKLQKKLSSLSGDVYISIDMDAFSPSVVPGVGTPQPGGIEWYDMLRYLKALLGNEKIRVVGVDLVELVPDSGVSQIAAAKLVQKIVSYYGIRYGFDMKKRNGSQTMREYE